MIQRLIQISILPPEDVFWTILVAALATGLALFAHTIVFRLGRKLAARSPGTTDDIIIARSTAPMRWIFIVMALAIVHRRLLASDEIEALWQQATGFALPALCGWLTIAVLYAYRDIVDVRADISIADNFRARRRRTRVGLLVRIVTFLILFLTVSAMLLSIPGVRNFGITLMASAGIAGIVVGSAAQPALKNLIAGVQMAFTEPIHLDDVLIIQNEWGRVETIGLTFVVVKLWDERRLIVPVSKFLEEPFQNWTRETSQLLGSVFLYVDPTADVGRIRIKAAAIAAANSLWDQRFTNLQVTDLKDEVMELRVLVTASDAARAFDLRCDVREALMTFLRDELPEALPRRRIAQIDQSGEIG